MDFEYEFDEHYEFLQETYQSYLRFQSDLEFIQLLSNPKYLHFLAKYNYFRQDKFRNYLKYLEYFRESKYLTYIRYPHCLKILELLNKNEDFIRLLDNPNFIFQLFEQQFFHWFTNQPKLKIQEKEQIKEIV